MKFGNIVIIDLKKQHKMGLDMFNISSPSYFFPSHFLHENLVNANPDNGYIHFADNIFKCISLNEKLHIMIKILLKFVPNGSVSNDSSFVKVIAW